MKSKLKEKSKLKVGDIIKFHSWGVGGFLFGTIIKKKEDIEDYELHDLLAEVVKPADKIGIHYNFNMEV